MATFAHFFSELSTFTVDNSNFFPTFIQQLVHNHGGQLIHIIHIIHITNFHFKSCPQSRWTTYPHYPQSNQCLQSYPQSRWITYPHYPLLPHYELPFQKLSTYIVDKLSTLSTYKHLFKSYPQYMWISYPHFRHPLVR
jgi:hypothetical protein